MPLLTTLTPTIDLSEVWQYESRGQEPRPSLRHIAEALLPEAQALIAPAAVFDLLPVQEVRHDRITLQGGHHLRGRDAARLLAPAREVAVGIVTIGPALEERASHYFAADKPAHGYLLDCLGTAAVTNLVQQVCMHLESLATARGWPLGFPLSPGDAGWPLTDQRVLFELLPAQAIGVRLTESCIMIPKKSVSFVVGLGPGILTAAEGSQCDYCSLRDTCRYRHRPESGGVPMPHA